jgi:hypothetical protein
MTAVPPNGVPANGVPPDGVPADGVPADGAPRPRPRPTLAPPSRPRPRPRPTPTPGPAVEPIQVETTDVAVEEAPATPASRRSRTARRRAERRNERRTRLRRWTIAVVSTCVVLGLVAVAAVVLIQRTDDNTKAAAATARSTPSPTPTRSGALLLDAEAATGYLAGTTSDIAAITSYDYRALDDALSVGLTVTTGAYRKAYRAALTGSLATDARKNHTVQTFDLLRIGIGEMSADGTSAKLLVFGLETIADNVGKGETRHDLVTLTATVEHHGDSYLISQLDVGANAGVPPGTPDLTAAAEAGRQEVVNLLTYRYEHFDVDYNRALAGAVEPLRTEIADNAADTKASITQGEYDLTGSVSALAVERASGDTVVLLVAATGTKLTSAGTQSVVTDGRYAVTVVKVAGAWVTSEVSQVGPQ